MYFKPVFLIFLEFVPALIMTALMLLLLKLILTRLSRKIQSNHYARTSLIKIVMDVPINFEFASRFSEGQTGPTAKKLSFNYELLQCANNFRPLFASSETEGSSGPSLFLKTPSVRCS